MNNTILTAVVIGALVLGLGIAGWAWNQRAPMGPGMMGGYGYGPMGPDMMGPMGGMMQQGMGYMHGIGGMHSGMMRGWGCCGGMQTYAPLTPQQSTAIETNAVELSRFAFNPPVIKVRKGTTVTWTNRDSVPHTVAASDGSFRSGLIQPGQSWSLTFDRPGTFSYFCEPHPFMQGQIIVEE